jgi:uncharacterized protein
MKSGFKVIDSDGHMIEPLDIWEKYTDRAYRDRAPQVTGHVGRTLFTYGPSEAHPNGMPVPRPDSVFTDVPDRYGPAYESWWSLATRLEHMDSEGIDMMVTFATNGATATSANITDPSLQAALCRAYNDWATEFCADSGGRVKFVAKITLLGVDEALSEIERVSGRPEVAAVVLADPGPGHLWSSPEFDKLWAALDENALAACFHGGRSQNLFFQPWTDGGLAAVSHAISFPVDAMLAMSTMILGGVLERFPQLRLGFFEANSGWVPWWLARLDDHAVGRQSVFNDAFELPLSPSEYFARQCCVSVDVDEQMLEPTVDQMSGKNLMFNSDYPHPDAPFPGSVDTFLNHQMTDEAKREILWDNPVALYGERLGPMVETLG